MSTQTEAATYTYIEVQALLASISEVDIARLLQTYRVLGCEARSGLTAQDVFSEVCCKVLALERAWPRSVATIAFLVETGRSVVANEEKKYSRHVSSDPDDMNEDDAEVLRNGVFPSPDTQIAQDQSETKLEEWITRIEELFASDEEAKCFITQKLAAMEKAAISLACKFTDQVYRNVEKRIKDKVRKRFPKGIPWWEIQ